MFAPKVAKPQAKAAGSLVNKPAPQRSMLLGHRSGHASAELATFLQSTMGNQVTPRLLAQQSGSLTGDEHGGQHEQETEAFARKTPGTSWDFSNIPVFPPDRASRLPPSFPLGATPLPGTVKAKLVAGQVNDPLEHEADRVADQVMRMPESPAAMTVAVTQTAGDAVQRWDTRDKLQRKSAAAQNGEIAVPSHVHDVLRSPGEPLSAGVLSFMEPRFGHDFGHVRIHDGALASQSAEAVQARAYTVGSHITFRKGEYAPGATEGRRLLAHELTHVVQQDASRRAPEVVRRAASPAHDLVTQYTFLLNLDEEGLGAELVRRTMDGAYDFVQNVLDDLHSTDRDDVSVAFMEAAPDPLVARMAGNDRGRRLLDRLYDELTQGSVGRDEQRQANRILAAKAQRIGPTTFAAAANNRDTKIFPLRIPGPTVFSSAPITASRNRDGTIHANIPALTFLSDEFKNETRTLPPQVATQGIDLPENEVVGVKLYDLGGPVKFAPALFLVELSNQTDTKILEKIGAVSAIGLTLGAGALAGLGIEATVAARVLAVADRVALVIGAVSVIINDHRGWILSTFEHVGAPFLQVWDVLDSMTALYGFARVVLSVPKLIISLREAYKSWRSATDVAGLNLGDDERTILKTINADTDNVLTSADDIEATAKPSSEAKAAAPDKTANADSQAAQATKTSPPETSKAQAPKAGQAGIQPRPKYQITSQDLINSEILESEFKLQPNQPKGATAGGHTLSRHVYISDAELQSRALSIPEGASKFYDEDVAVRAINDFLSKYDTELRSFLEFPTLKEGIDARFVRDLQVNGADFGYGYQVDRATGAVRTFKKLDSIRVTVLKFGTYKAGLKSSWAIQSAHPLLPPP